MADHVSFNFNAIPVFSSIAINDRSNHLGDYDAVSQVSSDCLGLFTVGGLFLGLSQLLDESVVSLMDTVGESPSLSGSEQLDECVHVVFNELLELDASVGRLLEGL